MSTDRMPFALLLKLARTGNMPHALLFTGEDESNTKKAACKFAQWLLHGGASSQSSSADFSDFWQGDCSCISCSQVLKLCHPDFCLLDTQLTIGEVRSIIKKFSLAPFVASRKIAVITHAHQMADAAGNALLKILEEPKGNALFILVAKERSSVLSTIASRALEVRFVAERETLLKPHFTGELADVREILQCFETGALFEQFLIDQTFTLEKKPKLCAILDMWLLKLREKILDSNAPHTIFALKQILNVKKLLMTSNGNPALLMEELHLKLQRVHYA